MTGKPGVYVHPSRAVALTGRALALLAATERIAPCDLFTPEQYDAIRKAGLDVFFVGADTLLGVVT